MMNINEIEKNVEFAAGLLKALSNEKRLLIICALHRGEKSVSELEAIIELSQSALSQHLARLRRDKLVRTRRDAQTIYYSLDHDATTEILKCLYEISAPGEEGLQLAQAIAQNQVKSKLQSIDA